MEQKDQQKDQFIEVVLQNARPAMKRYLGMGPKGYDAADAIADAIGRGIEDALARFGDGLVEDRGPEAALKAREEVKT